MVHGLRLASPDNAYSAAGTQTKLHGIYTRTIAAQIVGFNRCQLKIVLGLASQYFLDNFVITTAGASASCSPPTFLMRMTPRPCASWMARP
jgi:hypothetical protein